MRRQSVRRCDPAAPVAPGLGRPPTGAETLWAMVAIQFVMTMAFSMLTPIMPLLLPELGVRTEAGINLWAGILTGSTSFIAAFASPLWGSVADRHGRKLMLLRSSLAIAVFTVLMGIRRQCLAVLRVSRFDGRLRRLLLGGDCAGGEPGAAGLPGHSLGWLRRPDSWSAP